MVKVCCRSLVLVRNVWLLDTYAMSYTPGTKISFKKGKEQQPKSRLFAVGTKLSFTVAEGGDYIVRRFIPVRYVGVS